MRAEISDPKKTKEVTPKKAHTHPNTVSNPIKELVRYLMLLAACWVHLPRTTEGIPELRANALQAMHDHGDRAGGTSKNSAFCSRELGNLVENTPKYTRLRSGPVPPRIVPGR